MPARGSYLLKIAGKLQGDLVKSALVKQVEREFPRPPGPGKGDPDSIPGPGWPEGFVLKEYQVCDWVVETELDTASPTPATLFTFRAEVHHSRTGSLYDNRDRMLKEVRWFYHYREYQWHKDLLKLLTKLNERIEKEAKLVEKITYCHWQWYCGDGGS